MFVALGRLDLIKQRCSGKRCDHVLMFGQDLANERVVDGVALFKLFCGFEVRRLGKVHPEYDSRRWCGLNGGGGGGRSL
eukprot:9435886-Prorocentrum_lima.AAC.1